MEGSNGQPSRGAESASLAMLGLITSYRVTQAIHVAAKLGIADLLKDGPRRCDDLAAATAAHAPSLYRLLRALAGVGVFEEIARGTFRLTRLGEPLRSDVHGSMRAWAIMVGGEHHWQPWGHLDHSVQTGRPAFNHVFGMGPFEYYAKEPEAGQIFQEALRGFTQIVDSRIIAACELSGVERLIDVGGGQGALLRAIMKAHPRLSGVLFDTLQVIARAAPPEDGHRGPALASGDFFESVPEGGDAYLLKHILHDWDDERAITILGNCHRAMAPGGRILVVEMVIPEGNDAFYGKLLDLEMLVGYSGRERTAEEYRELLDAAGLRLTRITATPALVSVIEAIRA